MDPTILLSAKERTLVKPAATATMMNTRVEMPVHPALADKPLWNGSTSFDRKERETRTRELYAIFSRDVGY